jgi:hypothetical protein
MILRPWMYALLSLGFVSTGVIFAPNLWLVILFVVYGCICMAMCYLAHRIYRRSAP